VNVPLSEEQQVPGTAHCVDKIRIVIADDHLIFRQCLCRLLGTDERMEVVAQVGDGAGVAGAVNRYAPDVLLLDLNMPGGSGFDALEAIRHSAKPTRVILLTGSEASDDANRAMKLGASAVVTKQDAIFLLIPTIYTLAAGELRPVER
jgi:DNA-binding NarL/FixJ family response regulator